LHVDKIFVTGGQLGMLFGLKIYSNSHCNSLQCVGTGVFYEHARLVYYLHSALGI